MSDLFKSALGYFSGSNVSSLNNELVGQVVEINAVKLRVKDLIAEGGFSFVYVAQSLDKRESKFALKRLLAADSETNDAILQEITILKTLTGHNHIIQYVSSAIIDKSLSRHGMVEHLILTELCEGGALVSSIQARGCAYPPDIVCRITWQMCRAVQHMHAQTPPIIHRDLKIENLLISSMGKIKLCDFGSATSEVFRPDNSWSAQQRALLEDRICAKTTPMYRAPEMVDTWSNHEIGMPSDIWAVGCVVYLLCYNKHPFDDSAKLRILNANYSFPPADTKYKFFQPIIGGCLVADPGKRLTISGVLERLASIAESNNFSLNNAIPVEKEVLQPILNQNVHNEMKSSPVHVANYNNSPAHQSPVHKSSGGGGGGGGGLFSQLKGGAGSFLRNLKDTSSKVVQSVQQTMTRGEEMAASYITSRICVINYTDGPECLQDMRCLIESRHRLANTAIYNLTTAVFPIQKFPNATIVEAGWSRKAPSLQALYTMCQHMHHFLLSHSNNVAIVTCNDGKVCSAMLVCGFLLYVGFLNKVVDALQLYAVKRTPPNLQPSHQRYLQYFSEILSNPSPVFTVNKIKLVSVVLQPVPLFNKVRDGCRPFLEVFQGEDKVFTSIDEYERLTVFTISNAKVVLPIGSCVSGDITICVYHARQVLTRITPIKMFQLQFNTAFLPPLPQIHFNKQELDEVAADQENLNITINCDLIEGAAIASNSPWAKHSSIDTNILFTSKLEADETAETFVEKEKVRSSGPQRPAPPRPNKPPGRPNQPPSRPSQPPIRPSPPLFKVSTEDLLNINKEEKEELLQESDLVETVDLLNLGEETSQFSNPGCTPSITNTLFEPFQSDPQLQPGISVSENLFGDWSDTEKEVKKSEGFGEFQSNGFPGANLPPPNVGMNKIHSAGNLKNIGTSIQRNVSYPNLKTDPFEEFISSQSPKSVSTANSPAKTPGEQPNYSRTNFESTKPPQPGKKSEDVFGDLLGSQGYSFTSKKDFGPKTINEMRREDQVKITDPDKLKILDWTEGKKNNIRALLTSLHNVVWSEAKWNQCYMHQLVSTADVKKAYRKACIAVHPDKHIGTSNEKIAKMIFMELNNAWAEFEKENH